MQLSYDANDSRPLVLIRQPEMERRLGHKRSSTFRKIAAGLLPPPVRLGPNSKAWGEHEIDAIAAALLAGKSDAELRELVQRIVAARQVAA